MGGQPSRLLVSKGDQGIDAHGAARRYPRGGKHDTGEERSC